MRQRLSGILVAMFMLLSAFAVQAQVPTGSISRRPHGCVQERAARCRRDDYVRCASRRAPDRVH